MEIKYDRGLVADVFLMGQLKLADIIGVSTISVIAGLINQLHQCDIEKDITRILKSDTMVSYVNEYIKSNKKTDISENHQQQKISIEPIKYDRGLISNIYLLQQLMLGDKIEDVLCTIIGDVINEIHQSNFTKDNQIMLSNEMINYQEYVYSNQKPEKSKDSEDIINLNCGLDCDLDSGLVADIYLLQKLVCDDTFKNQTIKFICNAISQIHKFDLENKIKLNFVLQSGKMAKYRTYAKLNENVQYFTKSYFDHELIANFYLLSQLMINGLLGKPLESVILDTISRIHGFHFDTELDREICYKNLIASTEMTTYEKYVLSNQEKGKEK